MHVTIKTEANGGWEILEAECSLRGATVLDALKSAGVGFDAPCGGDGTCGKCRVLVRDSEGVRYCLACKTLAREGATIVIERARRMKVSTSGMRSARSVERDLTGYGVSLDIGTTTLVCRLVDLSTGMVMSAVGRSNPQVTFGADVISRIAACFDGYLGVLRDLLLDAVKDMVLEVTRDAGVELCDVTRVVLAGNTTMEHIAAGIDPSPIGVAPFTPPTLFGFEVEDLFDLPSVFFAPCIAGYVGGDIACGILATNMLRSREPVLLLDLGTNGEMALGDEGGVVACATAVGPVFEGASIRFGMPAYPGAISGVRFENGELCLDVIGGGAPIGICGTGLIDAVAIMIEHGALDDSGFLLDEAEAPDDIACFIEEIDGEVAFRLADGVYVTQRDVRCLQLAKAAVCAGMMTLLEERGLPIESVSRLLVAGGFGEYLDLANAARVGLFPEQLVGCAQSVGNTAIEGATMLLCDEAARRELDRLIGRCRYLELSSHRGFNSRYVEAMPFADGW